MAKYLIQLPEGLKRKATSIATELEAEGHDIILSGDPCFGACDLRFLEDYQTLHYGHSKMIECEHVKYEPYRADIDLVPIAIKALNRLPERVALASTIQHSHRLPAVKQALEKQGKKVLLIPKGKRCSEEGQVLGCDLTGAEQIEDSVDGFLFIGSGLFHAMGIAFYTEKPVIRADPYTQEITDLDATIWKKERALRQTKASEAGSYGIIVSSKPGQNQMEKAKEIKEKIEAKNLRAYLILMDEITPDRLLAFDVDAFIITACPRIVIDDWKNYKKAVLLPEEAEL